MPDVASGQFELLVAVIALMVGVGSFLLNKYVTKTKETAVQQKTLIK